MANRLSFLAAPIGMLAVWAAPSQTVLIGDLPPGKSITIELDLIVANPVSPANGTAEVCSQGVVSGVDFPTVMTDDASAPGSANSTCTSLPDFGDAPAPYPTLIADNGAVHAMAGGIYLGTAHDADSDGQVGGGDASGDDSDGNDDDDGVVFVGDLIPGQTANIEVAASAPCLLDAWYDFDGMNGWDPTEQVFMSEPLSAGLNMLQFTIPADAVMGDAYSRFRCSSAGGLSPTGAAADGEVEDYRNQTVPVHLLQFDVE